MSEDITTEFDAPIIEPIAGIDPADPKRMTDVRFARADMDYLTSWAAKLKEKRLTEGKKIINTMPGIGVQDRILALRKLEAESVSIFTVMDLRMTGEGIAKFLDDAMERAGHSDPALRLKVRKRIGVGRQYAIVEELLSEPRPTIQQFRDAVRKKCLAEGMAQEVIDAMADEQLIEIAAQPQQKAPTVSLPGAEGGAGDDADPLAVASGALASP
jgi:hypothetical protein